MTPPASPAKDEQGRCYHCGDPLPDPPIRVRLGGKTRSMCCTGCAAAAEWIGDAGLGDYYRLREGESQRVDADETDLSAWDREDVQAEHVRDLDDGSREITVVVDGMHCAACAWLIDRALRQHDGVCDVSANAVTGRVELRWLPGKTALSSLLRRLSRIGYRPYLASGEAREQERRRERRRMLIRLGVAGLGAMQVMMFAEALYLDSHGEMPVATRDFFRWIALLVSTPVVFFSGWPFLAGLWREIQLRRLGMDTLVGGSILLAWSASLWQTLREGDAVWFDAAVMFVLFLLSARFLEQMARQRANAQVEALARARPSLALREESDGQRRQVAVTELQPGDLLYVAAGEALPADGELLQPGRFDESLLSGESRPRPRDSGQEVFAGSVCLDQPVRLRVLRSGGDTRLSHLVRLVEQAQSSRPPLAQWADRIASRFVATVLLAAVVVFGLWSWQVGPQKGFEVALTLMVVSCPCALSLAVPAALAAAHSGLARLGVLALSERALFALPRVDSVLMDKTGTLTCGRPQITAVRSFGDLTETAALKLAAALEAGSSHPLARAFGQPDRAASDIQLYPGLGIEGLVDGRRLRFGRADFACSGEDDGALWLGDSNTQLARFEVGDTLREDAMATVTALRSQGLRPEILSGDGPEAVQRAAQALGIGAFRARLAPEDKLQRIRELQADGHRVLMVGDGINDAPVLAAADLSIAMADGAALAHRAADVVILGGALGRIPAAMLQARRLGRVVRENLIWALAYNAIALPVAAFGLVTPGIAALGMAISSLGVTLNALRLARPDAEVIVATPDPIQREIVA